MPYTVHQEFQISPALRCSICLSAAREVLYCRLISGHGPIIVAKRTPHSQMSLEKVGIILCTHHTFTTTNTLMNYYKFEPLLLDNFHVWFEWVIALVQFQERHNLVDGGFQAITGLWQVMKVVLISH